MMDGHSSIRPSYAPGNGNNGMPGFHQTSNSHAQSNGNNLWQGGAPSQQSQHQHQQQQFFPAQMPAGAGSFDQGSMNSGFSQQQIGIWPPNQMFTNPFGGSQTEQFAQSAQFDGGNLQTAYQQQLQGSGLPQGQPNPDDAEPTGEPGSNQDDEQQKESSAGPIRFKTSTAENREKAGKAPIAAPVKAACTFCRSRKSRCDGKQPCATCIAREKVDDCVYTVSRRGGKPKAKRAPPPEVLENHLRHLVMLSEFPHTARVPDSVSGISNIRDFSTIFPAGREDTVVRTNQLPSGDVASGFQSQDQINPGFGIFGANGAVALGNDLNGAQSNATWMQGGADHAEAPSARTSIAGPSTLAQPTSHAAAHNSAEASSSTLLQKRQPSAAEWSQADLTRPTDTRTLIEDYYKYLHRFVPVLPSPQHIDALVSLWKPQSPFLLALQTVLPYLRNEIQPADPFHGQLAGGLNFDDAAKKERMKITTSHFEKLANEAVDQALENVDGDATGMVALEVIQALCVHTVFDYGNGRTVKARMKADQALGLAMAQGFHRLRSSNFLHPNSKSAEFFGKAQLPDSEVFEMKKRCWWTVWTMALWAAYNTGHTSTLRADDPRVTCEMPYCTDSRAWIANIRSLQTLLTVQDRVISLANLNTAEAEDSEAASPITVSSPTSVRNINTPVSFHSFGVSSPNPGPNGPTSSAGPSRNSLFNSMLELDRQLEEQIEMQESQLAAVRNGRHIETFAGLPSSLESAEDALIAYLHTGAAVQLYTSSLTLHIGQAFRGASLFERKLCFLKPATENANAEVKPACQEPVPSNYLTELAQASNFGNPGQINFRNDLNLQGDLTLGDIFNPFSWMTQNFGANNAGDLATTSFPQPMTASAIPNGPQPPAAPSSENGSVGQRKTKKQSPFARGPFSAQHSLGRCVRASIRLLEIASNKKLEPNPFNACSFVLISYVLLMLAMSRGVTAIDEDNDHEDDDDDQQTAALSRQREAMEEFSGSEQLLQLAGMSTDGTFSSPSLQQIWNRVQQARDSLAALSQIWEMVTPMVWEINSCLETSRTLFSAAQQ